MEYCEWIFKWLKDPSSYWHETAMPNLRLTDQEAKDLTAYLYDFKNIEFDLQKSLEIDVNELDNIAFSWLKKAFPVEKSKSKLASMNYDNKIAYVADKSIRHYGCYTCHTIEGFDKSKPIGTELTHEGSKPLDKLDFGHIHSIGHNNYSWFEQKLANPRIYDRDKIVNQISMIRNDIWLELDVQSSCHIHIYLVYALQHIIM